MTHRTENKKKGETRPHLIFNHPTDDDKDPPNDYLAVDFTRLNSVVGISTVYQKVGPCNSDKAINEIAVAGLNFSSTIHRLEKFLIPAASSRRSPMLRAIRDAHVYFHHRLPYVPYLHTCRRFAPSHLDFMGQRALRVHARLSTSHVLTAVEVYSEPV
ncbi:hypothetical protein ACLOJK_013055 [Asimina triloba]